MMTAFSGRTWTEKTNDTVMIAITGMVLAHVMTDEENKEILRTMIQELFPVKGIATPYMYHHIVEALFEGGLNDEAENLIRDYWGKMLELGADTFWEAFDPDRPDYSPYGSPIVNSYSHAWSCTPVYLLRKYIIALSVNDIASC